MDTTSNLWLVFELAGAEWKPDNDLLLHLMVCGDGILYGDTFGGGYGYGVKYDEEGYGYGYDFGYFKEFYHA